MVPVSTCACANAASSRTSESTIPTLRRKSYFISLLKKNLRVLTGGGKPSLKPWLQFVIQSICWIQANSDLHLGVDEEQEIPFFIGRESGFLNRVSFVETWLATSPGWFSLAAWDLT